MSEAPDLTPASPEDLGRAGVKTSGVLAALAVLVLIFAVWMFVTAVDAASCNQAAHRGESDPCYGEGIAAAIGFILGTYTLIVGSSMAIGAVALFFRPDLRGRVTLSIAGLIIGLPLTLFLAVQLIWVPFH